MNRTDDEVSASEIAAWAWCPESWRLQALGAEPGNKAALKRGTRFHRMTTLFERWSAVAIRLGWWLFGLALVLSVLGVLLVRS